MAKKFKLKNKDSSVSLTVALSLILNVLIYIVVVFLILFTTQFDWDALYPRWVLHGETVEAGTVGAWYDLGVFVISGIVQILGIFLYFNTFWGQWQKKSLEATYRFLTRIIVKFSYLMSNKDFREDIKRLDRENKIETWKVKKSVELQNLNSKLTAIMAYEVTLPEEEQSKKTRKFLKKEKDILLKLTDEWIEENIDYQKLKYPRLNPHMILYGKTTVVVQRYGIEDTQKVIWNEIIVKIIFAIISMGFLALFVALRVPELKSEVWNTAKDFVIYSVALILNIILGLRSSDIGHRSRIRQTEDRLNIIRDFVGPEVVKDKEAIVVKEVKEAATETLEKQLEKVKSIEK